MRFDSKPVRKIAAGIFTQVAPWRLQTDISSLLGDLVRFGIETGIAIALDAPSLLQLDRDVQVAITGLAPDRQDAVRNALRKFNANYSQEIEAEARAARGAARMGLAAEATKSVVEAANA